MSLFAQPRPGGGIITRPGGQQQQQQARREYKPEELCAVEGYVRNSVTGEALSKASVTISANGRQQQNYAATTDASGKFSIRGIEPGQYRISARRNGYVPSEQSGRHAVSPGAMLTLASAQSIKNVEAKLIPHSVVTGRITDLDGDPVAHANVQLMRYRYTPQGQRELLPLNGGETNDLGEYRLFGVPPGKYFVGVAAQDRGPWGADSASGGDEPAEAPVPTYYPGATEVSQATAVDVQLGSSVQGIDVRVLKAQTFRVSGQVVGAPSGGRQGMVVLLPRGAALAAAQMMQGWTGGQWRPDGKFTIRGVRPGSYTLMADSFDGDNRMRGLGEVEVGDRNVENAQVVMQPAFEMQGTVRLEGQGTMEFNSVNVNLQPRERGSRFGFGGGGGGRAGADGKVTFRQTVAGQYDVTVGGLPENHYVKSVRAGEVDTLAEGVHVLPGMQVDVVVSPNGGKISGGVVNEKGEVVSSASVILLAPGAPPMRRFRIASVDQQGQFQLSGIAPGAYFLAAVEDTESGAFWEPEFLVKNDKLIEKISIREGASETKSLKLIGSN